MGMPLPWGTLMWALPVVFESPAPISEQDLQTAVTELFQKLQIDLPVAVDALTWEAEYKIRVWKQAADDRETAEWVYQHLKALVRRHPEALDRWLRIAPRPSFSPKERAELLLDAVALNTNQDAQSRYRKELVPLLKALVEESSKPASCVADWPFPLLPNGDGTSMVLTPSQSKALTQITNLGRAYFSGIGDSLAIRPRFSAFLAAPTGSGKTYLAQRAAEFLDAKLFVVSASEWMPEGAREGTLPTLTNLLAAIQTSERVICFIDEVDKFILHEDAGAWIRCCAAEIWATLDRRLPVQSFCKRHKCEESVEMLEQRIKQGLYFIAAGTFQSIFYKLGARTCGFTMGSQDHYDEDEIRQMILEDSAVPAELLSRFAEEPIILRYPTLAETAELLEKLGLNELAAKAGVTTLEPSSIKWDGVGMRALEGLAARLICLAQDRNLTASAEVPSRLVRKQAAP